MAGITDAQGMFLETPYIKHTAICSDVNPRSKRLYLGSVNDHYYTENTTP